MTPRPKDPNDAGSSRPQSPASRPQSPGAGPAPAPAASAASSGEVESATEPKPKSKLARVLGPLIVLAIVAGSIAIYKSRNNWIAKKFGTVEAGSIYRSGQIDEKLIEGVLTEHKIAVVIDFTAGDDGTPEEATANTFEVETCKKHDIAHHRFPVSGSGIGNIRTTYAPALKLLHESTQAKKPVLVHCAAGAQRTGAAVAFYRMLVQGKPGATTMDEMESYGWSKTKNAKLYTFINQNMKAMAKELKTLGVIDQVPNPLPQLP